MAAATAEAVTLLVAGGGRTSLAKPAAAQLSFSRVARLLPVSCKRQRHVRRKQGKKAQPEHSSLKMKFQPDDESVEVHNINTDSFLDTRQETLSSDTETSVANMNNGDVSSITGKIIQSQNAHGGQQLAGARLEDLICMIRNAERNVLLLNHARVRALEDLDKIISEKEALQEEITDLEMKLAETDARLKVAVQEKIHVELLENQLEQLRNEMSLRNTIDVGRSDELETNITDLYPLTLSSTSFPSEASNSAIVEDITSLRTENLLLKDDIQKVKVKLADINKTEERVLMLEKERSLLKAAVGDLESKLAAAQEDVSQLVAVKSECEELWQKVESLQIMLNHATKQADQASIISQQNKELQKKIEDLEALLEEANAKISLPIKSQEYNDFLQQRVKMLEERLEISDKEIQSHVQLYEESVKEFQDALNKLKEESKKRLYEKSSDDMPLEFWSVLLLMIDGWLLENKLSSNDAKILREMVWTKDHRIRDAYLSSKGMAERDIIASFLKLTLMRTSPRLHIIHIAAEMAPVAKVGGLGDVVAGLSKALQRKGHLLEIILPKYDCMQYDHVRDLKEIDVEIHSSFDGQLFKNKVWVGTVEGLPVYFIEPHHPAKFFWRGQFYGQHDDFKRFSFFSRVALELLYQAGKKPDIIHCHDWQTAFVAPLYWDIYATKGFNTARICFTCHNFEYQGAAPASDLASCGLDVHHLNRPDRMQDNFAHDRVNPVKGAIVFSNIVTTVSPTYAQEVRTKEGGRGLHETLNSHARKFVGILNGIDTEAWNPATDSFLKVQYNADDLQGKFKNKDSIKRRLNLSYADPFQPLVGCITRLVPQKGVHLIRHAIYKTIELGGQFLLLGSSPVPHIQREFEGIAEHFQNSPHVCLILKYDNALAHSIYAAADMHITPSIFEPCGLTQMIAMRYGAVPVVRRTGGLNDSVFDVDDETIPVQYRNGFTFSSADEQGLSTAMERAFNYYTKSPKLWNELVQKDMKMDFGWDSSASQYEELYQKAVARARAASRT